MRTIRLDQGSPNLKAARSALRCSTAWPASDMIATDGSIPALGDVGGARELDSAVACALRDWIGTSASVRRSKSERYRFAAQSMERTGVDHSHASNLAFCSPDKMADIRCQRDHWGGGAVDGAKRAWRADSFSACR